MSSQSSTEIKEFWNENPVGSNFVKYRQNKSFYEEYDAFRYKTESHILKELDSIDFKNKKVLEIGLGQGADSMQIINRGAIYHGIDLTEESVRRLKERFELFDKHYESVQVANAEQIPYPDNSFDIVYSHGVIHHSPRINLITDEIYRVLKPGGKAIVMLYHKSSFNYYVSIGLIRRVGLLAIWALPFLGKIVSKLTGESMERVNKHIDNFKYDGLKYLHMKNFIHRSTDGPENVYSSVWTNKSARKLFNRFRTISARVHFLNERHLLGVQHLLPGKWKRSLASRYGWHLWINAIK